MSDRPAAICFADFEFDVEHLELRWDGHRVELQRKPLELLLYLAQHPDRVVSKEELSEHVWPDVHVTESALTSALRDVRKTLGNESREPRYIGMSRSRILRENSQRP